MKKVIKYRNILLKYILLVMFSMQLVACSQTAQDKSRERKTTGGNKFIGLTIASHANVAMKGGKIKKSKIQTVVENTASRNFVRQGVISKGAIIKVSDGLARVTSRPTRDGLVNAVLLK